MQSVANCCVYQSIEPAALMNHVSEKKNFKNFRWRRHFPNSSILSLRQNVETRYINSPSHCARSCIVTYSKFRNRDSSSFFTFWFSFTRSVYVLLCLNSLPSFHTSLCLPVYELRYSVNRHSQHWPVLTPVPEWITNGTVTDRRIFLHSGRSPL